MEQEYPLGTEVSVEVFIEGEPGETELLDGIVDGYCHKGYFPDSGVIKRYKIKLNDGSVIFTGASRIKDRS
jgi:hypothetical protein